MEMLLTPDQENTLKALSTNLPMPNGSNWYYMPYWFKEVGNGIYEQVSFENLPEDVKDLILIKRGIKM